MSQISFDQKDFIGTYGVCFDGSLVEVPSGGNPIPVVAVGHMRATGDGYLYVERTVKIGAASSVIHSAKGKYEVKPDGTGTAELDVFDGNNQSSHKEKYSFVIDDRNNELQFISTHISDANGGPFKLPSAITDYQLLVRGVGRKQ